MQTGVATETASGSTPVAMPPTTPVTAQRIGVPREIFPGEKRVATVPEVVEKLVKLGFKVVVESGAGDLANFADDTYRAAGAEVVDGAAALWSASDIVFKVREPSADEVALMHEGQTLISFIWPAQNPELMQQLAARKVTVLAIDALPRMLIRAQKMDALTSQAGVAGYRAVIEAANAFGRFFNGQITAAGKVPPAKVFIAGAGVAGLAAIGTAAGLGAIVRANDTRAEVADQVTSLGGEFVKVDYRGRRRWRRRLRQGDERGLPAGPARDVRQAGPGGGHHHHHRADPRQASAQADHRRDGEEHEARQRDRRHGGRARRQLRADRARPGRGEARRDHRRLHRPEFAPGQAVVDAVRHQPVSPHRRAVQDQGRHHQRQHGRRRHPRPDRHQGRQHHLAASCAQAARGARRCGQAGAQPPLPPRRAMAMAVAANPWPAARWPSCSAWPPRCSG